MRYIFLLLFISSCSPKEPSDTFFQYNIWAAFVNKVFEGEMTVQELKEKGNTGLGSFDLLDGELVMLDGKVYRIRENGEITEAANTDKIIYADAAFLTDEETVVLSDTLDFDSLRKSLNSKLPSTNDFYVFEIKGTFDSITLGGLHKQTPPFTKGLDYLIPNRPIFKGQNVKGTLVGFFCPQFIGEINTIGYHFHFMADDKSLGGHLMSFKSISGLKIKSKVLTHYEFRMPESAAFDTVNFDRSFQYGKN